MPITTHSLPWSAALAATVVLASTWPAPARAGELLDEPDAAGEAAPTAPGWRWHVGLGASLSATHSMQVVGAQDGLQATLGLMTDASVGVRGTMHEWTAGLSLRETFAKTPSLDPIIKSQDELAVQTAYLLHIPEVTWLAYFVEVSMRTPVAPGDDVRDADVTVRRIATSGETSDTMARAQTRIRLTDPFEPLELRQVTGVDARPLDDAALSVQLRAAVGGRETLTSGGYVLADDDTTPELELLQLESSYQVGAEVEARLQGVAHDIVTWQMRANAFYPAYTSTTRGLQGADLIALDAEAKLSVRLAAWLSLDYVLLVRRAPLVLDGWQVQNGLLVTFGFDFGNTPTGE